MAQAQAGLNIGTTFALPVSAIPDFVARVDDSWCCATRQGAADRLPGTWGGNLHYNVQAPARWMLRPSWPHTGGDQRIVYDAVQLAGGSISGRARHWPLKREELARRRTQRPLALMHTIKRALDPLNPSNSRRVLQAGDGQSPGAPPRPSCATRSAPARKGSAPLPEQGHHEGSRRP